MTAASTRAVVRRAAGLWLAGLAVAGAAALGMLGWHLQVAQAGPGLAWRSTVWLGDMRLVAAGAAAWFAICVAVAWRTRRRDARAEGT